MADWRIGSSGAPRKALSEMWNQQLAQTMANTKLQRLIASMAQRLAEMWIPQLAEMMMIIQRLVAQLLQRLADMMIL